MNYGKVFINGRRGKKARVGFLFIWFRWLWLWLSFWFIGKNQVDPQYGFIINLYET